jgi:hypothetical protein
MKSAPGTNAKHTFPASASAAIGPHRHAPAHGPGKDKRPFPLVRLAVLAAMLFVAIAFATHAERSIAAEQPKHVKLNDPLPGVRIVQNAALGVEVEDITGAPGEALPMKISIPPDALDSSGLVMIRGVPEALSFAPGFRTGSTWMVSLKELNELKLMVPDDFQGEFTIEVIFVIGTSNRRESRTASVTIAPVVAAAPEPEPEVSPTAVDIAPAITGAVAAPPEPSPDAEASMLERAASLLSNGDVAAARLLYEHMASKGSSLAALSMARSYDPAILPSLGVIGMRPDEAEARRWYERAASLGSRPAALRLEALVENQ